MVAVSKSLDNLLQEVNAVQVPLSLFTCAYALTESFACPEHPGSLEIVYHTLAAVICDDDASSSVITA